MDYITCFDIQLEKDVYYRGETIIGCVILENCEPLKLRGIRCFLRGRAKVNWKVLKSGETRVLKDTQYLLDEKLNIFGQEKETEEDQIQILPRGAHQFNFSFALPQSQQMPCSLETKAGTVRYYVKAILDVAYASPPQGIKYFSFIGPHIDCMDEKYLSSMTGQDHKVQCLRCCQRGTVALRIVLERTAYCCGESIRLRAHVENHQEMTICLCVRLFQHIEYRIERVGASETKHVMSTALEYRTSMIRDNSSAKFDSSKFEPPIRVPLIPPTMIGVCRLMQIYYVLKICVEDERKNETLEMDFPLTIATVPYRNTQSQLYTVAYDFCADYVESGKYISPEFRLGNVYDGKFNEKNSSSNANDSSVNVEGGAEEEDIILYQPVYVKIIDPSHGTTIARRTVKYGREGADMSESAGSLFGTSGVNGSATSLQHNGNVAGQNTESYAAKNTTPLLNGHRTAANTGTSEPDDTIPQETVTLALTPNSPPS